MDETLMALIDSMGESVPAVLLAVLVWFLIAKVWPWWSETFIPERRAYDLARDANQELVAKHLADAASGLHEFAASIDALCERITQYTKPP